MIKQKIYSRLNQRDRTMVLSNLTGLGVNLNQSGSKANNRGMDRSRGRVEIEADLCKGCLLCIEACPPGVLVVSKGFNKMGYHPAEYVGEKCTACGVCFYICPEPASIRVFKSRAKSQRARNAR